MMGVGKSTIGKILAKKLKLKFIDIDKLIEKKKILPLKKFSKTREKTIFEKLKNKLLLKN